MIDDGLRDLERRWRSTGDPEDLLRLTRAQVRSGRRSRDCRSLATRSECRCFACRELAGIPPARVVRVVAAEDPVERVLTLRWEVDDSGEGAGTVPPAHPPGVELRKFAVKTRIDFEDRRVLRAVIADLIGAAVEEGVDPSVAERVVLYGSADPMRPQRGRLLFSTLPLTRGRDLVHEAGQTEDGFVRSALRTIGGCTCGPRRAAVDCPFHGGQRAWGPEDTEAAMRVLEGALPDDVETVTFDSAITDREEEQE